MDEVKMTAGEKSVQVLHDNYAIKGRFNKLFVIGLVLPTSHNTIHGLNCVNLGIKKR